MMKIQLNVKNEEHKLLHLSIGKNYQYEYE